MGSYNIVNPGSMQPGVAEDITQIVANFTAIQSVLNGGLDNSNLNAGAAIDPAKVNLVYSTYAPAWTSNATNPSLGSSTVLARSCQMNKRIHYYGQITLVSGFTPGTGTAYRLSLPVNAGANAIGGVVMGVGFIFQNSSQNLWIAYANIISATTMALNFGAGGPVGFWGPTTPWAPAVGDQVSWNMTYEAA